jgi:homoserine O-acetyltransferase/O-succinyltransferase
MIDGVTMTDGVTKIDSTTRTQEVFSLEAPLVMECGAELGPVSVAYETYGTLNPAGDNAVLVCHALTGSAHAAGQTGDDKRTAGWWDPMIGPGRPLDTDSLFMVSSNFLGGCYGTTGSASTNPATGKPYGLAFPPVTVRDMVRVQAALLERLGVRSLLTVLGGSLGGMQVLEWPLLFPGFVRSIIPIATAARHSPWCIGLNDLARQAIMQDPDWRDGNYYGHGQPERGLSLARQIAMVSYRSDVSFMDRFGRSATAPSVPGTFRDQLEVMYQVERYLRYQGEKLVNRFDANTYLSISRAMDTHDVTRDRGTLQEVLGSIRIPALCVGIDSDILYPLHEQRAIAGMLPQCVCREIHSPFGHDAFLIEYEQLGAFVRTFLEEVP